MKWVLRLFALVHAVFAAVFALVAFLLLAVALRTVWQTVAGGLDEPFVVTLIEALGVLAVAVVALQISQTIAEEEVVREAHVSAPTRVRRFLSRFVVVIVIALAVESLVATMKALRGDMTLLPHAAASVVGVALLVAAWGYFIKANRAAEDIEPEAMAQAKKEDRKLE
jgi:hypothetical protein